MNIKDYISSGILEDYAMGLSSAQERQEVECMSKIYPELKDELRKVEQSLEAMAMAEARPAPDFLKAKIFNQIEKEKSAQTIDNVKSLITSSVEEKIIALPTADNVKSINNNFYKVAAVAATLIIGIASYFAFDFNQQKTTLATANEKLNTQLLAATDELNIVGSPNTVSLQLTGNEKANKKTLQLYWNKQSGNVYLSKVDFPAIEKGKQYQLWALKDGKPIDLGVFNSESKMQKMKLIDNCQSFAVTIEKEGGSPTPNLQQLCAIQNTI